jgi:hypothetical protein
MRLSIEPETNNTGKEEKGRTGKYRIGKIKGEKNCMCQTTTLSSDNYQAIETHQLWEKHFQPWNIAQAQQTLVQDKRDVVYIYLNKQ